MKAIGYQNNLPIAQPASLVDITLPDPVAAGHDLLVEVRAVSVNPVDTKVRKSAKPEAGQWKVLGWDATGTVKAVGPDVTLFKPGDRVWYAGSIARAGSNSELQLQLHARIARLEIVQPGQHHVAPEVGGHRDLQLAFDGVLAGPYFVFRFAQAVQ